MLENLRALSTADLVFDLILYGVLPLWLIMGFLDYCCHRRSGIYTTSGIKESIFHAIMGVQIGIPIFLGLLFEINVATLLVMLVTLVFHEVIAHEDVAYARQTRNITMFEIHVHSFLETLPFFAVALLACLNWNATLDLITLNWSGHLSFNPKPHGTVGYLLWYVALLLIADILPYLQELWCCFTARRITSQSTANTNGDSHS